MKTKTKRFAPRDEAREASRVPRVAQNPLHSSNNENKIIKW